LVKVFYGINVLVVVGAEKFSKRLVFRKGRRCGRKSWGWRKENGKV